MKDVVFAVHICWSLDQLCVTIDAFRHYVSHSTSGLIALGSRT